MGSGTHWLKYGLITLHLLPRTQSESARQYLLYWQISKFILFVGVDVGFREALIVGIGVGMCVREVSNHKGCKQNGA